MSRCKLMHEFGIKKGEPDGFRTWVSAASVALATGFFWLPASAQQPQSSRADAVARVRDTWRACAFRSYRELRFVQSFPALRAESAFQACTTEAQVLRAALSGPGNGEMVASVLRARLKQELLSLPEAAFTVGMKLRCEGVIENVSTKLIERRSEATVNILAKSVSVANAQSWLGVFEQVG